MSCKHHLALDVKEYASGVVALDRVAPGFDGFGEIPDAAPTCALDAAEEKSTCAEIADAMGMPEAQHVHMVVKRALRKLPEDVARFLCSRG